MIPSALPSHLILQREDLLPALLAGAATILVVATVLSRRHRGVGLGALSFLMRGALLAVMGLLLLEPVEEVEERFPGSLLLAMDMSGSVDEQARAANWDGLRGATRGDPAPEIFALGFGGGVRRLSADRPIPSGGDLRSDPTQAVNALLLHEQAGLGAARLALATDGSVTAPAEGLPVATALEPLVVAIGAGPRPVAAAESLELVEPPGPGAPVRLTWRGSCTMAGEAVLVAHVDGEEVRRVPVSLTAGAVELALTVPALPPGRHVIAARLQVPGGDQLDAAAVKEVTVARPPSVVLVSAEERTLVLSALRAQGLEVDRVSMERVLENPAVLAGAGVVVLDRSPAAGLSDPTLLEALTSQVEAGAGLLYLPPERQGELYDAKAKPFLDLLPLIGEAPPPPEPEPEPKPEPKPPPAAETGVKPPDPDRPRKRETRQVPSLGLLLLLDCSSSMKGSKLRLAKEAAIASAEVLHPKDLVGLIQFNSQPSIVLELTPSGDKAEIVDRISRVEAAGGTHFGAALGFAQEVFMAESLGIRHVILLSDGYSKPFLAKRLVTGMADAGITVSTVGCGGGFDEATLSDIAHWGKGRFYPAFDASEIPQIFTIEAERVIKSTGARHRRDAEPPPPSEPPPTPDPPAPDPPAPAEPARDEPEPKPEPEREAIPFRLGLPAPYLGGVRPYDVPGVLGLHPARVRPGAWVSLETTDDRAPILAHRAVGYGRVACFALPLEGSWVGPMLVWEDYQTLLAQLVRFLHPVGSQRRFHVEARSVGRAVEVRALDRESRAVPDDLALRIVDGRGRVPDATVERLSGDTWRVALEADDPAACVVARVEAPGLSPDDSSRAMAPVSAPPEVASRGLDIRGLEEWAAALGGVMLSAPPAALTVPGREVVRPEAWGEGLLPWVLLLLGADLLLRRLYPGRLE